MKGFVLLIGLAVLLIGCDSPAIGTVLSTEKMMWNAQSGTAVTISLERRTEDLQGASRVGLGFIRPALSDNPDEYFQVSDFTVPVMKVDPQSVTLFFPAQDDQIVLNHLPAELRAGNAWLHACVPNRVC